MDAPLQFYFVRKAQLRAGGYAQQWNDPHGLAVITPQKRQALLDNPSTAGDEDAPIQILGLRDNTVVGKIDLFAGSIESAAGSVPVLWTSAFYVPEEFRRSLVGVMLILKMQALCPTTAACAVSQMALPVFEKLKWAKFELPRYLMLRRSRSVVERYMGANVAARAAALLADVGLAAHRAVIGVVGASSLRRFRVEAVERADDSLNEKLRERHGASAAPLRSAAWINWNLTHSFDDDVAPGNRRGLFYVRDRGSGALLGYFILRLRFYAVASHRGFRNVMMGTLSDWMSFAPDQLTARHVIALATRELARWHADVIEICTDEESVGRWLRRRGLLRVGSLAILIRAAPGSPLAAAEYQRQSNWRLAHAEGDNLLT